MDKSIHQCCMDIYYKWHTEKIGFKPKIDASDGKGLKETIKYLSLLTENVCETFEYILLHWDEMDEFYKKQTRLRQINGNIHNIIFFFKNGQATKNKSGVSEDYIKGLIDDMHQ